MIECRVPSAGAEAHTNLFSKCSAAMYSPCASLNMFLMRSTTFSVPAGVSSPTSPVWKNPSESAYRSTGLSETCHVSAGLLKASYCLVLARPHPLYGRLCLSLRRDLSWPTSLTVYLQLVLGYCLAVNHQWFPDRQHRQIEAPHLGMHPASHV